MQFYQALHPRHLIPCSRALNTPSALCCKVVRGTAWELGTGWPLLLKCLRAIRRHPGKIDQTADQCAHWPTCSTGCCPSQLGYKVVGLQFLRGGEMRGLCCVRCCSSTAKRVMFESCLILIWQPYQYSSVVKKSLTSFGLWNVDPCRWVSTLFKTWNCILLCCVQLLGGNVHVTVNGRDVYSHHISKLLPFRVKALH